MNNIEKTESIIVPPCNNAVELTYSTIAAKIEIMVMIIISRIPTVVMLKVECVLTDGYD